MSDRNLFLASVVCSVLALSTAGCIPSFFGLYSDEDLRFDERLESEDATLITATTEVLQAFVQRISEDPKAFPVENECSLERRRTAVGFG